MILDILALTIWIVCIISGMRRGFVRSLLGVLSFVIAIVAALFFYDGFSAWFSASTAGVFLQEKITGILSGAFGESLGDASGGLQLPEFLQKGLESAGNWTSDVAQSAAEQLAALVIGVLSVILLILVIRLVLRLILQVLSAVVRLPVLKQCNGLLGGIFGAVTGLFWVWLLLSLAGFLAVLPAFSFLTGWIDQSSVMKLSQDGSLLLGAYVNQFFR